VIAALAWRNLWRRPRRTILSVAGIAFSCAFLIFMPSLQNGTYRAMINNTLELYDGYAEIQQPGYRDAPDIRKSIPDVDGLLASLRRIEGLPPVSARAAAYVLLSAGGRSFGAQVVGVQPATEPQVSTLPQDVRTGRYLGAGDNGGIVLGATLARNLRVAVGDSVTLLGTGFDGSLAVDSLKVVGTFATGLKDMDRLVAQMPLARFQRTFTMPDQAHMIVLGGTRLADVAGVLGRVRAAAAPRHLRVLDWRALQPGLFQAIVLDASTAALIYVAMVVVVAFSLLNSLLMAVLERTREFGVLMALGMRPGHIGRMVWIETSLLLALGLAAGLALGFGISAYFGSHGIVFGQAEQLFGQFGLPGAMYPRVSPLTLLAGPGVIAFATLLAGLFPLWRVHRLEPVTAMRAA
jgi:ABC-type lipoprotein release transport system permease subunit